MDFSQKNQKIKFRQLNVMLVCTAGRPGLNSGSTTSERGFAAYFVLVHDNSKLNRKK